MYSSNEKESPEIRTFWDIYSYHHYSSVAVRSL